MSVSARLLLATCVALAACGLYRLRFDTDVLALLPDSLPTVRALDLQQRHFAAGSDLLITLHGDDPQETLAASQSLVSALRAKPEWVRRAIGVAPWEERPDLALELAAFTWLNQPASAVSNLISSLQDSAVQPRLAAARERLATSFSPADVARFGYDPLGFTDIPGLPTGPALDGPRFASDDGRFRIVFVTPAGAQRGYQAAIRWLEQIQREIEAWRRADPAHSAIRVRLTGGPAFAAEISQGMEQDMRGSVLGTAAIVAALFAWAYRRLQPLLILLGLLCLVLVATLAAGGLVFGRLNAVSLGFAAILLGLAVDYGLVLFQESIQHPLADAATLRRLAGPGIRWAAFTTAAAFATLTLGGLPGLTQLGALVAIGILIGAVVMLHGFVPPWVKPTPDPRERAGASARVRARWSSFLSRFRNLPRPRPASPGHPNAPLWTRFATMALLVAAMLIVFRYGWPEVDHSATPLRPLHSEAYAALDEMRDLLAAHSADPRWLIVPGRDESEVAQRLREAEAILASTPQLSAQLPTPLWPDPSQHAQNAAPLAGLGSQRDRFRSALRDAGFTDDAFRSAEVLLSTWERAASTAKATGSVAWPTNEVSAWIFSQVTSRTPTQSLALGFLGRDSGANAAPAIERLRNAGILVGGWDLLGEELLGRVTHRLPWVVVPMVVLWTGSLFLAFRSVRDVLLAVASVALAGLTLFAGMAATGTRWNLMNLMALPLLLGAGTDYAIHMQLALRRHAGRLSEVRSGTGKAILLCAATTIAGFGSLAWSGNAGLASLGSVCAAGMLCAYLSATWILPAWWQPSTPIPPDAPQGPPIPDTHQPSALYAAAPWRLALALARLLPRPILRRVATAGSLAYAALFPARRRMVADNLIPLLNGDAAAARRFAWKNFAAFGRKLADLWKYEAGRPVEDLFTEFTGWNHLESAHASGRGVLLLTPHIGNWEFGAPLLARRGIPLLVITLAEPGDGFTALRESARARWGIETLVIGQDPFAFVEIIKRLQAGAVVALLVDRPPPPSAVGVTLFNRPFLASVAGAELARATGCTLLPALLPENASGYAAHILPPIAYDRRALGNHTARRALTQDILRAFEPHLRQHPAQWFHFVPIWTAPHAASADSP